MPPSGLTWMPLTIRFNGSLETKQDVRLSSPPDFDLLRDVQFEELGALQTRPPFGAVMGNGAIFGGGTLSNCRRLAVVNGELCLFTDTGLYSWNAQLSAWVLRGTHLAVSVDETPRFATTGDQIDGDRAELNGTIVYAWTEGTQVFAAAIDKITSSVLVSPTAVSTAVGRPRLVALATKILLFTDAGSNNLTVRAIDPAAPGTAIGGAGSTVLASSYSGAYDVERAGTQDLCVGACQRSSPTSYTAFTVTPALSVATSTKARTSDSAIAVATIADGTKTQVIRTNTGSVQGDLLTTSTLADVFTNQAIGTGTSPINQTTGAFSSTTCSVFWSSHQQSDADPGSSFQLRTNTVTTANVVGTQSVLVRGLGLASRAFLHGSSVYVWAAFASDSTTFGSGSPLGVRAQLQNTYFLYRSDGSVVSKAVWQLAGGFSASTGHLPGVMTLSGNEYAWAGTVRRRIVLGDDVDHTGLAARTPTEIIFSFDDNAARRSAQLGRTLYLSGGFLQQYDGVALNEVGFHIYPWAFAATDAGGGGALSAGTYSWKATLKWQNATSETERSTTATGEQLTLAASHIAALAVIALRVTSKRTSVPNFEIWRTLVNAGDDAPYFLASSQDTTAIGGNNAYIPNVIDSDAALTFSDNMTDAALESKESNPENGSVLESLAPPGAQIIVPTETRLLLTGIAGDPDAWFYSRERGDGEVASFHDSLRVEVPPVGGAITALWADDQLVYIARATAIYAYAGPGSNNAGEGQNYTLVRTISRDVGVVSQEAHAQTPVGRLLKSSKGWYLLDGGGGLRYVGGAVADFDGDTVLAVHTITAKHQVRILTNNRMIVWDYRGLVATSNPDLGRWNEWTISDGLDACLYNGVYTILTASGPRQESASFTGLTYGQDVELAWLKLSELTGYGKLGEIQLLGEYRSACLVRLRIARDYQYDGAGNPTYFDDLAWTPSPTTVGSALQLQHRVAGWGEAFKIRITVVAEQARATLATASALSPAVQTSGTNWAATWKVADLAAGREAAFRPGEMGNSVTMSIAFASGATPSIDVRDHCVYSVTAGRWLEDIYNVGVLVTGTTTTTVAQLEAAISDASTGSKLCALQTADATPTKTLAIAAMAALAPAAGSFSGGAYTAPTGEAVKLTGLGLLVGIQPGLKRLPAAQKA